MAKVVVWFSCGSTSAVAAKLAVKKYKDDDLRVIYCDTRSEHEDNMRFLGECQAWIGQQIEVIGSEEYHDIWDVFEKTGWLVGPRGARCTTELKKRIRQQVEREWHPDIQVFGFDAEEQGRVDRFRENNPEVNLDAILLHQLITKSSCLGMLVSAGIEVPAMYRLGFNNANCIGCVKGQGGYWRKIKDVFPETYERMAGVERKMNVAINKTYAGDGNRKPLFLDEMPDDFGRDLPMLPISCDLACGMIMEEVDPEHVPEHIGRIKAVHKLLED